MMRPERPGGGGNPYTRSVQAEPPRGMGGGLGGDMVPKPVPDYAAQASAMADKYRVAYDPSGGMSPESFMRGMNSPGMQMGVGRMNSQIDRYTPEGMRGITYENAIPKLEMQLHMAQVQGAPPSVIAGMQMRLQQMRQKWDQIRREDVARYGAGGGSNSYIAQLIGMGGTPGGNVPMGRGSGPMRQR